MRAERFTWSSSGGNGSARGAASGVSYSGGERRANPSPCRTRERARMEMARKGGSGNPSPWRERAPGHPRPPPPASARPPSHRRHQVRGKRVSFLHRGDLGGRGGMHRASLVRRPNQVTNRREPASREPGWAITR
jgi:hypothetical protein